MINGRSRQYDVAIAGCGAAGLFAAALFAMEKTPLRIVLLEKNPEPGKKLLLTGNGHCNVTHEGIRPEDYRTDNAALLTEVFSEVQEEEIRQIFAAMGIPLRVDEAGRYYPEANKAEFVHSRLREIPSEKAIECRCGFAVQALERQTEGYRLTSSEGETVYAKNVLLSTGGKACPKSGSVGDGYGFARRLGIPVVPVHPALVQMTHEDPKLKDVKGVRLPVRAVLLKDGDAVASSEGELQLNPGILSGICMMDLSRFVIGTENHAFVCRLSYDPNALKRPLTEKEKTVAGFLTDYPVAVTGTKGWKEAQVTAGGISLAGINPKTMEALASPGLYFAGEILDADGICGGYNLHWAWVTAYLAANAILGKAGCR